MLEATGLTPLIEVSQGDILKYVWKLRKQLVLKNRSSELLGIRIYRFDLSSCLDFFNMRTITDYLLTSHLFRRTTSKLTMPFERIIAIYNLTLCLEHGFMSKLKR